MWLVLGAAACATSEDEDRFCVTCAADGAVPSTDGHRGADGVPRDGTPGDRDSAGADGSGSDVSTGDAAQVHEGGDEGIVGAITGSPCTSGASGRTALRVHWSNAGGQAQVSYDEWGMPDRSRQHVSAYGYQIGFTSSFVDPYLGSGGLQLDGSDFIDIELSTTLVPTIAEATLSLFGRSYHTTASGSFSWTSFTDTGSTNTNFVSNAAPYKWYSASLGSAVVANDGKALLRTKAGPSSGSLVVNQLEICIREK